MNWQECANSLPQDAKVIPGFPSYCVTSAGVVYSCRVYGSKTHRLGPWWEMKLKTAKGYYCLNLQRGPKDPTRAFVHQLVMLAFAGPPPEGMEVRHLNDIKTDNRLCNLAYGTRSENVFDRVHNGIALIGEDHPFAVFTNEQVREIRRLRAGGLKLREIGSRFNTSAKQICSICKRRTYKHVTDE